MENNNIVNEPEENVSEETQHTRSSTVEEEEVTTIQESQQSPNNSRIDPRAELSITGSSVVNTETFPSAGGDNASSANEHHRIMECLREIIQCPVCFTVPHGMRIYCCRNGHTCCRQCLIHFRSTTRTLLRRPFCPVCRTSMVRRKVFRNFVAEQIVAEYTAMLNENQNFERL